MKHSIRTQMMVIFAGLLAFMFAAILICNVWLLEPYYIKNKQQNFDKMYESLSNAAEKGTLDVKEHEEEFMELVRQAEKENMFFIVIDTESGQVYTNVLQSNELQQHLDEFLLDRTRAEDKILEKTDDYELSQSKSRNSGGEYLMMRGTMNDEYFFLIQSPVESIQTSVALANRFLILVGGLVILICLVLVWFFSKRLTDPLHELAELSQKMEELDFEAKYTSGGDNEIGVLGKNFNRMSEKLEHSIADLKRANNQLQRDIEQKEKMEQMKNEFIGNVSHELKTPIALIQGYAEGLKEGVNDDPESREFYCDVIMDESAKMNQMVKNLLTLNQLEFGDEEIQFERFDLVSLARGVIDSMALFAEQTGAKVVFRHEEPIYVWGDQFKVEQVIRNYLSNAFNHVGGKMIIEVKIKIQDDKARMTVFNTGNPIPEEDIEHVWEKFYKVDKAHTREYGGNGIGLSIVKAIMESLHQEYGVSNYDNGVAFWLELGIQ